MADEKGNCQRLVGTMESGLFGEAAMVADDLASDLRRVMERRAAWPWNAGRYVFQGSRKNGAFPRLPLRVYWPVSYRKRLGFLAGSSHESASERQADLREL